VFSTYGSYDHYWSARLHSVLSAGFVRVRTLDIQPGTSFQQTRRYNTNLIWAPVPRLELVSEFLYGLRINKDTHREDAMQLQVGSTFRF